MKNSIKFAEENGYVLTISNRKIFIHDRTMFPSHDTGAMMRKLKTGCSEIRKKYRKAGTPKARNMVRVFGILNINLAP